MNETPRPPALATLAVTAGRPAPAPDGPLNGPIVLSSTYHAGGPVGYGRYGNPTWSALEDALGALDGGTAVTYASGIAAVVATLSLVPDGGIVVAPRLAYLGTLALLADPLVSRRLGQVRLVDLDDTEAVVKACDGTAMVWLEAPANPLLEVPDLAAIVAAARSAGALVVLDETFATPILLRGLDAGVDVVVHSATKYLSGHGDVVLGAAVATDQSTLERLVGYRSLHGAIPGPVESWVVLRGLRTLALRVERAQASAGVLATRLQEHPAVHRVRYPGLPDDPGHQRAAAQLGGPGAIVSIELAAGAAAADALCSAVRLWVNATSLGSVESTLERRRRWSRESVLVPESLVRLSVGIEDVGDLWADLEQALG